MMHQAQRTGWVREVAYLGLRGETRARAAAFWLGAALVAPSWRLPLTAIATAIRRRRAAVRVAPVSWTWLREYEAECVKREGTG